jgi:Sulfotransferase family
MSRVSVLLDQARAATGLTHFGDDGFSEGLERLVESADREANLNAAGRAMFDGQCLMLLRHRLQIEDCYARHPEIDGQQIVAPLIVLGLPRTGSSALHCLLAEDPAARVLRSWESMFPCPPPETATQYTDPRIELMQQQMDRRARVTPRMQQMVPSSATSPTEDQLTMAQDFKSQIFQASFRIPSYTRWLVHEADLEPTFIWQKRVMKLLQWHCPPTRWRLKCPTYSLFINAFDRVFPDARYCMTHRDVANVLPSVADLYFEMNKPNTDVPDKRWMGEVNFEFCDLGMRRMMAFRDAGNEHRFFDIRFAPFQQDPFPTMQRLYDFLGEEFTSEARARMEQWRREQPRDKHGRHEYDAAEFGLDRARIHEHFRFYSDRFEVPLGKD